MALIKNLHLLEDNIKPGDLDKMEVAAAMHQRHSSIEFKIVDISPQKVTIQIVQGRNGPEVYQTQKRLIEIVHETYDRFFPGRKIIVHAVPFVESPAKIVDAAWINKMMLSTGTRLKDIAGETDIDYTQLSSLVSDNRPLSKPMKALFWYYFKAKKILQ